MFYDSDTRETNDLSSFVSLFSTASLLYGCFNLSSGAFLMLVTGTMLALFMSFEALEYYLSDEESFRDFLIARDKAYKELQKEKNERQEEKEKLDKDLKAEELSKAKDLQAEEEAVINSEQLKQAELELLLRNEDVPQFEDEVLLRNENGPQFEDEVSLNIDYDDFHPNEFAHEESY